VRAEPARPDLATPISTRRSQSWRNGLRIRRQRRIIPIVKLGRPPEEKEAFPIPAKKHFKLMQNKDLFSRSRLAKSARKPLK
jgi:hypothetical protein